MPSNDLQPDTPSFGDSPQLRRTQPSITVWPFVSTISADQHLPLLRSKLFERFATDDLCDGWESNDRILHLTPVAEAHSALQLAEQNVRANVIATVDHFVQVEVLQQAAQRIGTTIRVLVAVNSGAHFFGCRAGTEVCQLALAIDCQPNLVFHGITTELPADFPSGSLLKNAKALAALRGSEAKLNDRGLTCGMLHLRSQAAMEPLGIPDQWHLSVPAESVLTDVVRQQPADADGESAERLTSLTAIVISRPSLEVAILNCGTDKLGPTSAVWLSQQIRLPVRQIDPCRCVVDLTGAFVELIIGQQVQISREEIVG